MSKQTKLKYFSYTMGNLQPSLLGVIKQVFESAIQFRTIDLKWKYRKEGF